MSDALVFVDRSRPHISVITLNRPDKRNALNIPLLRELCEAIESANEDEDQRVIVLAGAGASFCAGLDLKEAMDPEAAHDSAELLARAMKGIVHSPKVTIAAAQGAAIAGGAGFMMACDLSVAGDDLKTGFTEVRRGLVAGLIMTFIRRKLPESAAREMLILGDLIGAERALSLGMVNRVAAPDKVLDEALGLAAVALKGAPKAIMQTKSLYNELYHLPVGEHIPLAQELHESMRGTEEAREGLGAFQEKRLPTWDPEA